METRNQHYYFGEPTNGKFYKISNTIYASAREFVASLPCYMVNVDFTYHPVILLINLRNLKLHHYQRSLKRMRTC